jgi:hypothetical protein
LWRNTVPRAEAGADDGDRRGRPSAAATAAEWRSSIPLEEVIMKGCTAIAFLGAVALSLGLVPGAFA